MSIVINNKFGDWLRAELDKRGWSYREMERRSEVSYATIGNIINNPENKTYPSTIKKIAKTLDADEATIMKMAGYDVPVIDQDSPIDERFQNLLSKFPDNEKEKLLDFMTAMLGAIKSDEKKIK